MMPKFPFIKNKNQLTILIINVSMLLAVVLIVIFTFTFLFRSLSGAINVSTPEDESPVRFNLEKARELGL
ncbi:MAG: hypothetical protein UX23_C0007G0024 [Parcubacteria group bacterium GW2011_GWB1_45_9]|nr:MAG: hypothetical protein UX23_C0007G0024 [Parcubacteria group bacterium GW2011_GWB1_45_9]